MIVQLKFLGSLQYDLRQQNLPYQITSEKSVRELVSELTQKPQFEELKSFFLATLEVKRSLLIFINEQEISVLNGMSTKVKANDTVAFIPVIHGGTI